MALAIAMVAAPPRPAALARRPSLANRAPAPKPSPAPPSPQGFPRPLVLPPGVLPPRAPAPPLSTEVFIGKISAGVEDSLIQRIVECCGALKRRARAPHTGPGSR